MKVREITDFLTKKDWVRIVGEEDNVLFDDYVTRGKLRKMIGAHPILGIRILLHEETNIPMMVIFVKDNVFVRGGKELDCPETEIPRYLCPVCGERHFRIELRYLPMEKKYMCERCLNVFKIHPDGKCTRQKLSEDGTYITGVVRENIERL